MLTRKLLTQDANQRIRAGDNEGALRGLLALVRSAPHDLDARLRIGDALLIAGDNTQAIRVYGFVAREASLSGHPLKAIVALKILARIDPAVNELLGQLGQRYAAGSPALGKGVRLAPPSPEAEVPAVAFVPNELSYEQVRALAAQAATLREGLPGYPANVAPIPLLSDLPPDAFAKMLAAVKLERLGQGASIIREGEPGDAFYMLARGTARVTRRAGGGGTAVTPESDVLLATLGEGSIVGEMALVSGAPRAATVSVVDDADVLVFGRDALGAVARELEVVGQALERFTRDRLIQNLLATHPIFKPFDRAQRVQLAGRFSAHDAPAGTVIIRQGDVGRGLFLLLSGQVEVTREEAGQRVVLATLNSGDVFGEISLIEQSTTTATVTAVRNSTVLFLSRELFERLVQGVPELRSYFESLAQDRIMDTNLMLSAAAEPPIHREEELDEDDLVLV
jgi:CRP-like cAMP-binding protein